MPYIEYEFNCTKCGKCCCGFSDTRGVILFPQDIKEIAIQLRITESQLTDNYCYSITIKTLIGREIVIHYLNNVNTKCIFLDNDNLCKIFENRPIQCKKAPFNFFWSGSIDYDYSCVKSVDFIPKDWSTWEDDVELISQLYNQQKGD